MNTSELESYKPGAALMLSAIPETAEAVATIEEARAVLSTERAAVIAKIEIARKERRLGVSLPDLELQAWHHFQATALRHFHEVRADAAGRCLLLCDEKIAAESADIRARENRIALGLGKMMADAGAGQDLAMLLLRLVGTLPSDSKLRTARHGWHSIVRASSRACKELPGAPKPTPTNTDQIGKLKHNIQTVGVEP